MADGRKGFRALTSGARARDEVDPMGRENGPGKGTQV